MLQSSVQQTYTPKNSHRKDRIGGPCLWYSCNAHVFYTPGPISPGGALECNQTGRCPFFKSLHNPFRKKICILIPCFGIFRLQNNRKTIVKTIAYCSWKQQPFVLEQIVIKPFRNFWSIFIPRSGIYAEKWYPEKRHVPYRFIWKCPPGSRLQEHVSAYLDISLIPLIKSNCRTLILMQL